jgi:Ulp1 family protease
LFPLTASPAARPFPEQFDTFAKDIIIVPINLGGSHWVCAAVNFEKKRIEYYDSLGKARPAVYAVRSLLLSLSLSFSLSKKNERKD